MSDFRLVAYDVSVSYFVKESYTSTDSQGNRTKSTRTVEKKKIETRYRRVKILKQNPPETLNEAPEAWETAVDEAYSHLPEHVPVEAMREHLEQMVENGEITPRMGLDEVREAVRGSVQSRWPAASYVPSGERPDDGLVSEVEYAPTTLDGWSLQDGEINNCLEACLAVAGPGDALAIFEDQVDGVGHVLIRHADGSYSDPFQDKSYKNLDAFMAAHTQNGEPRYVAAGTVLPDVIREYQGGKIDFAATGLSPHLQGVQFMDMIPTLVSGASAGGVQEPQGISGLHDIAGPEYEAFLDDPSKEKYDALVAAVAHQRVSGISEGMIAQLQALQDPAALADLVRGPAAEAFTLTQFLDDLQTLESIADPSFGLGDLFAGGVLWKTDETGERRPMTIDEVLNLTGDDREKVLEALGQPGHEGGPGGRILRLMESGVTDVAEARAAAMTRLGELEKQNPGLIALLEGRTDFVKELMPDTLFSQELNYQFAGGLPRIDPASMSIIEARAKAVEAMSIDDRWALLRPLSDAIADAQDTLQKLQDGVPFTDLALIAIDVEAMINLDAGFFDHVTPEPGSEIESLVTRFRGARAAADQYWQDAVEADADRAFWKTTTGIAGAGLAAAALVGGFFTGGATWVLLAGVLGTGLGAVSGGLETMDLIDEHRRAALNVEGYATLNNSAYPNALEWGLAIANGVALVGELALLPKAWQFAVRAQALQGLADIMNDIDEIRHVDDVIRLLDGTQDIDSINRFARLLSARETAADAAALAKALRMPVQDPASLLQLLDSVPGDQLSSILTMVNESTDAVQIASRLDAVVALNSISEHLPLDELLKFENPLELTERLGAQYPMLGSADVPQDLINVLMQDELITQQLIPNLETMGFTPSQVDQYIASMAEVRNAFELGATELGDAAQVGNWLHTRAELVHATTLAMSQGLRGEDALKVMYASLYSDAIKTAGLPSLLAHNHHAAMLARGALTQAGFDSAFIDDVTLLIRTHQPSPPSIMASAMTGHLKMNFPGEAHASTIESIVAKIGAPFEYADETGRIAFTQAEQELLNQVGIPQWSVMPQGHRLSHLDEIVRGADSWQYLSNEGIVKIGTISMEPGGFFQKEYFRDAFMATFDVSWPDARSITHSDQVLSVLDPEAARAQQMVEEALVAVEDAVRADWDNIAEAYGFTPRLGADGQPLIPGFNEPLPTVGGAHSGEHLAAMTEVVNRMRTHLAQAGNISFNPDPFGN